MAEHGLFDEIWGKWYFNGQPVKVAKLENAIGDHFSNYTFSAFKQNIIGSKIEATFDPFLLLKLFGGGLVDMASWSWQSAKERFGYNSESKPSRPSFAPGIYYAAAGAVAAYGIGGPIFMGPSGKTNIVITDQSDLMYFGTSVRIRRAVNAFEFNFKESEGYHNLVTAVLVAGMAGLFATSLAIRLAWYDFDPVEAEKSENKNFDSHTLNEKGITDWEGRWATPNAACKLWIPLAEGIWASLLMVIDNLLARQVIWVEWQVRSLRRELAQQKWDIENLERWSSTCADLFVKGWPGFSDTRISIVEVNKKVAKLEEQIAEKQAELDQYTTEISKYSSN
jgi:hypothetical protein